MRIRTFTSLVAASLLVTASADVRASDGLHPPQAREPGWIDRTWLEPLPLPVGDRVDREPRPLGSWWTTLALGGAAVWGRHVWAGPETPRWEGGVLFDDSVRDALRVDSDGGRQRADAWSDVLLAGLWTQLAVETALVRGRAAQMDLWRINLDAMLLSVASNGLAKFSFGRERPSRSNSRSFPSGHAASAATAAGLVCSHHLGGKLSGGGWSDRLACGAAALGALGTGVLRVASDDHYATDVLAGWASGFFFGYLLPRRWHDPRRGAETRWRGALVPMLGRGVAGFVYVRRF